MYLLISFSDLDKLPDVLMLTESLNDVDVRNESDVLVDRLSDFQYC